MRPRRLTRRFVVSITLAITTLLGIRSSGYTVYGIRWHTSPVPYRVNTANLDLTESAVEAAVRAGADAWTAQTNASFRFAYAGRSSQTTVTSDGINLVVFRNASSGSAIATTYTWSDSKGIVDADIVFWDGAFRFYTGSSGCSNGLFVEDIATHEFGHALGLGHSAGVPGATMAPAISYCDTGPRTLHADDIAGVLSLYPPQMSPPSAPTGVVVR
jgi:hypothetical protein